MKPETNREKSARDGLVVWAGKELVGFVDWGIDLMRWTGRECVGFAKMGIDLVAWAGSEVICAAQDFRQSILRVMKK